MSAIVSRTIERTSTYVSVVISPATTTSPVVTRVSQATRPSGSSFMTASRTASEIWSATLSGCPSVTDSDVNWNVRALIASNLSRDPAARQPGSLDGRIPLHQPGQELGQRDPVEDGADALGDRHLDAEPVGEVAEDRCRGQALDHHPDLPCGLGRGRAPRDELAAAAVASRLRPAGDDQVAHAGEPGEGLGSGAGDLGEAPHLDEPAGHERRLGVVAEPEPVGASGGERDD